MLPFKIDFTDDHREVYGCAGFWYNVNLGLWYPIVQKHFDVVRWYINSTVGFVFSV